MGDRVKKRIDKILKDRTENLDMKIYLKNVWKVWAIKPWILHIKLELDNLVIFIGSNTNMSSELKNQPKGWFLSGFNQRP